MQRLIVRVASSNEQMKVSSPKKREKTVTF